MCFDNTFLWRICQLHHSRPSDLTDASSVISRIRLSHGWPQEITKVTDYFCLYAKLSTLDMQQLPVSS